MLPALLLASALACTPMTPNSVAVLYWNPPHDCTPIATRCRAGEPMTFRVAGNYNFGCGPHVFSWKFSDGTIMTGQVVVKTFDEPGVHQVDLTVANPQSVLTITRVIAMGVQPFDVIATPLGGRVVELRALRGTERDLGEWTWSFGDGTFITTRDDVVTHAYAASGRYVVTLSAANAVPVQAVPVVVQSVKRRAAPR